MKALGMIDCVGWSTAVQALDAACKAADVHLIGVESIIGMGGKVGVSIHFTGDVAAVQAAVDAGVDQSRRHGVVIAYNVIPRPHEEIDKLIEQFRKNIRNTKQQSIDKQKDRIKSQNNKDEKEVSEMVTKGEK